MPRPKEVAITAGLSIAAMIVLFGAVVFWITAGIARDPQAGGSAALFSIAAFLCALLGVGLLVLAVRRVYTRFQ